MGVATSMDVCACENSEVSMMDVAEIVEREHSLPFIHSPHQGVLDEKDGLAVEVVSEGSPTEASPLLSGKLPRHAAAAGTWTVQPRKFGPLAQLMSTEADAGPKTADLMLPVEPRVASGSWKVQPRRFGPKNDNSKNIIALGSTESDTDERRHSHEGKSLQQETTKSAELLTFESESSENLTKPQPEEHRAISVELLPDFDECDMDEGSPGRELGSPTQQVVSSIAGATLLTSKKGSSESHAESQTQPVTSEISIPGPSPFFEDNEVKSSHERPPQLLAAMHGTAPTLLLIAGSEASASPSTAQSRREAVKTGHAQSYEDSSKDDRGHHHEEFPQQETT